MNAREILEKLKQSEEANDIKIECHKGYGQNINITLIYYDMTKSIFWSNGMVQQIKGSFFLESLSLIIDLIKEQCKELGWGE